MAAGGAAKWGKGAGSKDKAAAALLHTAARPLQGPPAPSSPLQPPPDPTHLQASRLASCTSSAMQPSSCAHAAPAPHTRRCAGAANAAAPPLPSPLPARVGGPCCPCRPRSCCRRACSTASGWGWGPASLEVLVGRGCAIGDARMGSRAAARAVASTCGFAWGWLGQWVAAAWGVGVWHLGWGCHGQWGGSSMGSGGVAHRMGAPMVERGAAAPWMATGQGCWQQCLLWCGPHPLIHTATGTQPQHHLPASSTSNPPPSPRRTHIHTPHAHAHKHTHSHSPNTHACTPAGPAPQRAQPPPASAPLPLRARGPRGTPRR